MSDELRERLTAAISKQIKWGDPDAPEHVADCVMNFVWPAIAERDERVRELEAQLAAVHAIAVRWVDSAEPGRDTMLEVLEASKRRRGSE